MVHYPRNEEPMKLRRHIQLVVYESLAILLANVVAQAQSIHPIAVTDADTSQPVACLVNGIQPDGKSLSLGKTDPPGQFKFTGNCVDGYALQFIPENGSIYYQASVFCKEALSNGVKLKRIPMPESAKLNVAIAKEVDLDPGSAAFFSNLLATKLSSEAEVHSYKITALVQWGKFLNVTKSVVYDGKVAWFEPSDDLAKATKAFQSAKGLNATGIIDSKTLKSGADPIKIEQLFEK